ncbi:RES family NAD+ phosphorylase [Microbulbifer salipaludis]|uniref:RES family NAD+ phosphorylase n=1 Tax=Microbulbifer salipaludis TaxID=187980 RepID=A0ABS3E7Z5_9GAMM|nr:RES family NAD+ phosphorylase [Microbulbifer salipaludis]MBN8431448.1 RES family NAD+ phosphorylase [Microbulbifer salipaludis]
MDDLFHILTDDLDLESKNVIKVIDYQIPLYRARIASSINALKKMQAEPCSELGPTPPQLASDQRMSPSGISVFYGAFNRSTCISEIRPIVGDLAVSAEFRALSKLNLIDLNKLPDCSAVDDIYHDDVLRHSHARSFFKELVFSMSRPARRAESNPYLSTQFIFEY